MGANNLSNSSCDGSVAFAAGREAALIEHFGLRPRNRLPTHVAAPRPVNSWPAGSVKPRRHPFEGAPVAGAPGWYVVRRTAPVPSGDPLRWSRRFRLTAVAVTAGLVALVLVLSMVRAHWSEAPAEQAVVVAMPPLAISPGTGAAPGPTLAPNAPIEEPGRPRNTLAAVALQTKPDPVLPDELAVLPLQSPVRTLAARITEALQRSTAEWESRPDAAAPSAAPYIEK